jgi:hypothetical protein
MTLRFGIAAAVVLGVATAGAARAGTLWFGNDGAGTEYHTTTTGAVLGTISESLTGVAWDGHTLYVGDPGATIEKKTLDGSPLPGTFTTPVPGSPAEDMAWDPVLGRLFRVYHNVDTIQEFDTSGGNLQSFALPTVDPTGTLTSMGTLGVAYDSQRNQLDISFCNIGCGALGGVVLAFDPMTLAYISPVFTSTTSYLGGLGYDPVTDTLWVGGENGGGLYVGNYTRGGTLLSSFSTPVFGDGMEYISGVPETGSWMMMLAGFTALAFFYRGGLAGRARNSIA